MIMWLRLDRIPKLCRTTHPVFFPEVPTYGVDDTGVWASPLERWKKITDLYDQPILCFQKRTQDLGCKTSLFQGRPQPFFPAAKKHPGHMCSPDPKPRNPGLAQLSYQMPTMACFFSLTNRNPSNLAESV